MSQSESMAIPMEGRLSKSELLELKNKMNARALAKKRSRTALRLVANVVFAVLITSTFVCNKHRIYAIE